MWNLIISLIMAVISYLTTKRGKSENNGKALAAAALAGVGSYYLLGNTEWGQDSVAWLNGNVADLDGTAKRDTQDVGSDGKVVTSTSGGVKPGTGTSTNVWDTLRSWGGTGTAAVIGTTAVATSPALQKYLPWLLIGGAVLLITR